LLSGSSVVAEHHKGSRYIKIDRPIYWPIGWIVERRCEAEVASRGVGQVWGQTVNRARLRAGNLDDFITTYREVL
jgi:hypothetical protein